MPSHSRHHPITIPANQSEQINQSIIHQTIQAIDQIQTRSRNFTQLPLPLPLQLSPASTNNQPKSATTSLHQPESASISPQQLLSALISLNQPQSHHQSTSISPSFIIKSASVSSPDDFRATREKMSNFTKKDINIFIFGEGTLYDVLGNIWELCHKYSLTSLPKIIPPELLALYTPTIITEDAITATVGPTHIKTSETVQDLEEEERDDEQITTVQFFEGPQIPSSTSLQ